MTKTKFLEAYRKNLIAAYPWTKDAAKLDNFMEQARATICDGANTWISTGPVIDATWKEIGCTTSFRLHKLRALPV